MAASAFIILRCSSFQFYIKPQPCPSRSDRWQRCSSFQFYIKPQQFDALELIFLSCSSFQFYIKPQRELPLCFRGKVVPHSNSTSNHNWRTIRSASSPLFLIPILHQTTTRMQGLWYRNTLFLIPILHQTTTRGARSALVKGCSSFQFYIKPQLIKLFIFTINRCSSFQFYIKPQHIEMIIDQTYVVPHSNSTSNHNLAHGSNSYSARYTYDTDA